MERQGIPGGGKGRYVESRRRGERVCKLAATTMDKQVISNGILPH